MIKVEQYKDEHYQFLQIKYDNLELLRFVKSNEDDNKWIWVSEEMNVEDDYVMAESFDEAVYLLKDKIMDFYNEKMEKYESIAQEVDLSMNRNDFKQERKVVMTTNTTIKLEVPIGYMGFKLREVFIETDDLIIADGRELSRIKYSELFKVIGCIYGEGDGVNTFNIPDGETNSCEPWYVVVIRIK